MQVISCLDNCNYFNNKESIQKRFLTNWYLSLVYCAEIILEYSIALFLMLSFTQVGVLNYTSGIRSESKCNLRDDSL